MVSLPLKTLRFEVMNKLNKFKSPQDRLRSNEVGGKILAKSYSQRSSELPVTKVL